MKIKITGILGKVIEQTNATKNKIKFRISPILFIRSRVKMIVWELFTVIKVKGSGGMNAWVKKGNLQILKIHLRAIFFIFIFIFILGVFLYGVIIYYGGAIISWDLRSQMTEVTKITGEILNILNIFLYRLFIGCFIGYVISYFRYKYLIQKRLDKGGRPINRGHSNNDVNKNEEYGISIIISVIIVLLLNLLANFGFNFINYPIYCDDIKVIDPTVDPTVNVNNKVDDTNYQFSISKNFVKEGFDSIFRTISESLPELIGTFGGAKIGAAVVKSSTKLPPVHRAILGVVSGGAAALALGLGGTAVKNVRKNSEFGGGDDLIVKIPRASFDEWVKSESGKEELVKKTAEKIVEFNKSNSTGGTGLSSETGVSGSTSESLNNATNQIDWGGGDGGNFIPSLLDENLSPLEIIINCEMLINIMLLFHIVLLVLILIQKYNIKMVTYSNTGFISIILKKYNFNKLQNFITKIGKISDKYLSFLILINVLIIVFYILINIFINIELSRNLSEYIYVYNMFQFKKSVLIFGFNNKFKYSPLLVWNKIKNKFVNRFEQRLYSFFSKVNCNSNSNSYSNSSNDVNNVTEKNIAKEISKSQENSYSSFSNAKGIVKGAAQGVVEGIGNVIHAVIGGMVGASLGASIIKASGKLPPVQKAALGVATAVAGWIGVTIGTGLGREFVKNVSKTKEVGSSESSGSGSNVSASKGVYGYIYIFSVLEDELSPLQMILNYELISCILIFVHIIIIILILLHKKFFNSGLKFISKLFSPKTVEKYEKFKKMTENLGNSYLKILIIINVIFILLNLFIITFVNVELSNNIDAYILVHLKMKENVSMLLLVKSNFSTNNNKKEKFKNFNLRSRTKKLRIVLKSKLKMVKNI